MNCYKINYRTKTASYESIIEHLNKCDDSFNPPLHSYVNIQEYGKKISNHAVTFEAWDGDELIGLAAAYFNNFETKVGFWTNLSLLEGYRGCGIASNLTKKVIAYGRENGFIRIDLEVKTINTHVLKFHAKHGFMVTGENGYSCENCHLFISV
jgi:ribosomal protein S18 acetylase RimI-like enzyme